MAGKRKAEASAAPTRSKKATSNSKKGLPSRKQPASKDLYPATSQASRQRRRFRITRESLFTETETPEEIEALAASLLTGSPSLETWGTTFTSPIIGTKRKSRKPTAVRQSGSIMTQAEMMEDMHAFAAAREKPKQIIPNTPERSPILRLPLEVREMIYAHLLTYPKPILMKPDLVTPERNTYLSRDLLLTCKLFAHECTAYIYRTTTFQILFRYPRPTLSNAFILYKHDNTILTPLPLLPAPLHHLLRTLVLDLASTCWDITWFTKTAVCLQKLVKTQPKPALDSLTLAFSHPRRVGMSSTALGMQGDPVAFADFLWDEGAVMQSVLQLCPRVFRVLVKKGGSRWVVEVEMGGLREGGLARGDVVGLMNAGARREMIREEIRQLKKSFEDAFGSVVGGAKMGRWRLLSGGDETAIARVRPSLQQASESSGLTSILLSPDDGL